MDELLTFLRDHHREDIKDKTIQTLLELTGTKEGRELISSQNDILDELVKLSSTNKNIEACKILINISSDEDLVPILIKRDVVKIFTKLLFKEEPIVEHCTKAVCNLTREIKGAELLWNELGDCGLEKILAYVLDVDNRSFDFYAPLLSNISQLSQVRNTLLNPNRCLIPRIMPLVHCEHSTVRRSGIIGTLRNCCFDTEHHKWLLSSEVDMLPTLLLPLAGPEVFNEEEMEKLPPDLQYLGPDKQREQEPELRCMIIETLSRLCIIRSNRELIRNQGALYLVLRELHKWESDRKVLMACENLVDILIRTEEEIGVDDFRTVQIPEHLTKEFNEADTSYLNS